MIEAQARGSRVPIGFFILGLMSSALGSAQTLKTETPAFRIAGVVVDSVIRVPLPGTEVAISPVASAVAGLRSLRAGVGKPHFTKTKTDGSFMFDHLAAGKYSLTAARPGYRAQSFDEHENFSTAIVVGPSEQAQNLVFRLRPDAEISGKITDENNDPVRNAQVFLFRQQKSSGEASRYPESSQQPNDEGAFLFPHLLPGKYFLAATAQPWYAGESQQADAAESFSNGSQSGASNPLDVAYPVTFFPGAIDPDRAQAITLAAGQNEKADLVLRAVAALHLRVRNSGDALKGLNGIVVKQPLFHTESLVAASILQGPKGAIQVNGLPPGHYVFEVAYENGRRKVRQKVDLDHDGDIELSGAEPSALVTGSVIFEGGQSQQRSPFILQLRGETASYAAQISQTGALNFYQEIPAGNYTVQMFPEFVTKNLAAKGAVISGDSVEVTGQNPIQLTVIVSRARGRVDGIALKNGQPWGGAMVLLVPENPLQNESRFRRDQSDSDGTFTLYPIAPGTYSVLEHFHS